MISPPSSPPAAAVLPRFVRAHGGVRMAVAACPRGSEAMRVYEAGGYRVRFPRVDGRWCEAVLINTGGGMTGGDENRTEISAGAGADCVVTTQAAEKIYRSQGMDAVVSVRLEIGSGARFAWLPQETILFNDARLKRSLDVAMSADASLTLVESVMFGRIAMGETFARGFFADSWRVRRDGRLVLAEAVRLDDPARLIARPALGGAAQAQATFVHIAPDAEGRLEEVRGLLAQAGIECGASAWNGLIVARMVSGDAARLRAGLVHLLTRFRGAALPRSWCV